MVNVPELRFHQSSACTAHQFPDNNGNGTPKLGPNVLLNINHAEYMATEDKVYFMGVMTTEIWSNACEKKLNLFFIDMKRIMLWN